MTNKQLLQAIEKILKIKELTNHDRNCLVIELIILAVDYNKVKGGHRRHKFYPNAEYRDFYTIKSDDRKLRWEAIVTDGITDPERLIHYPIGMDVKKVRADHLAVALEKTQKELGTWIKGNR